MLTVPWSDSPCATKMKLSQSEEEKLVFNLPSDVAIPMKPATDRWLLSGAGSEPSQSVIAIACSVPSRKTQSCERSCFPLPVDLCRELEVGCMLTLCIPQVPAP